MGSGEAAAALDEVDLHRLVGLLGQGAAVFEKGAPGGFEDRPVEACARGALDSEPGVIGPIADPGNLGALLRSAEAAGVSAVVCLSGGARPFGPKALRGSMGSALRVQLFAGGADRTRAALSELGFRQVRAAAKDGADASDFDFSGRFALWIGGETEELSGGVEDLESITIPTAGGVESLNVAVAGAVLLFVAGRNRGGADG